MLPTPLKQPRTNCCTHLQYVTHFTIQPSQPKSTGNWGCSCHVVSLVMCSSFYPPVDPLIIAAQNIYLCLGDFQSLALKLWRVGIISSLKCCKFPRSATPASVHESNANFFYLPIKPPISLIFRAKESSGPLKQSLKEKLSDLQCNANGTAWLQDWTTWRAACDFDFELNWIFLETMPDS